MRFSTKVIFVAILSLVVLAAVLVVVSVVELRRSSERHMEAYLSLGLDYYVQEYPQRLYDLLQRHGLGGVPSFVRSYQEDAVKAVSSSVLQLGARIEVIRISDGQNLSPEASPNQLRMMGSLVVPHIQEHLKTRNLDENTIHFDPITKSFYVFTAFEPWDWIIVASAPDTFVRDEIRSVMVRTALTTTGIVLVAALLLAIVLRRFFVAPVLRIARAAQQLPIAKTISLLESSRTDELGSLARDIVQASLTIGKTQRELQAANDNLELVVEERTQELAAALDRQKTLVREVHHRVKNNMSVVQSLLELQKAHSSGLEVGELLSSIQRRIASMSLIHEQLNRGDGTLSRVDSATYLEALVKELRLSLSAGERSINFVSEIESVPLSPEVAMPCGLITNELVSNATKYAFPDNREGTISEIGRAHV